ncbi:protein kinase [Lentisphaera marina]|uniref:serine/threonine protein kinase n=1 Tax=Lentisphaera marina TaxID=1111041 RepID=UPI0023667C6B|nr:serine/threonine-protein kinase [Lentisphaera marina]MDD7983421.1 protein kinase [Lentisphaera marina]
MRFKCTSCGQSVSVDDGKPGEAVQCGSCGTVLKVPKAFEPGYIIGDFCVSEHIGSGRMGEVYKAYQETLVRDVALKVLDNDMAEHSEHILEFFKEARVAARLNHPNIVQAYSVNEESGYYYLVVEYVFGQNLRQLIDDRGKLPVNMTIRLLSQIAHALDYAWTSEGLPHLSVKPENILIDSKGQIKISDIGLAGSRSRFSDGDYKYSSPEQILNLKTDTRADIYALGVTAYEALTGQAPFDGNIKEVNKKHLEDEATTIKDLNPSVPKDLATVIDKMMSKHPDDRYMSFGDLAKDLRLLRRYVDDMTTTSNFSTRIFKKRFSFTEKRNQQRKKSLRLQILTALITVLLLVGIIVFNSDKSVDKTIKIDKGDKKRLSEFTILSQSMDKSISSVEAFGLFKKIESFLSKYPSSPQAEECLEWREAVLEILIRERRQNEFFSEESELAKEEGDGLENSDTSLGNQDLGNLALQSERDSMRRDILRFYLGKKSSVELLEFLKNSEAYDPMWSEQMSKIIIKSSEVRNSLVDGGVSLMGLVIKHGKDEVVVRSIKNDILMGLVGGELKSLSLSTFDLKSLESLLSISSQSPREDALSLLFWFRNFQTCALNENEEVSEFEIFLIEEAKRMAKFDLENYLQEAKSSWQRNEVGSAIAQILALKQKYKNTSLYESNKKRVESLEEKFKKSVSRRGKK